jgi:RNA polymerase-binding transcription factor DksA
MPRATKAASTSKKAAAKQPAKAAAGAKKTAVKKAAVKKAPAKKAVVKKAVVKKATPVKATKKSTPTKVAPKVTKATTKAAPAKKAAAPAPAKAAPAPAPAPAPRSRPVGTALGAPAPVKKALPKKSPFDARFLAAQREMLLEERATYLRQANSLKAEADALVADVEPGDVQFDEESGEGATLAVERERDLALSAQARDAVDEIDAALHRLDIGTYGMCEVSGEAIPKERLKAIPWARERVEYKAAGLSRR